MKKTYEKPTVETVKFQYRDQVVVASGGHKCVVSGEYSHYKGECGSGDASATYNN